MLRIVSSFGDVQFQLMHEVSKHITKSLVTWATMALCSAFGHHVSGPTYASDYCCLQSPNCCTFQSTCTFVSRCLQLRIDHVVCWIILSKQGCISRISLHLTSHIHFLCNDALFSPHPYLLCPSKRNYQRILRIKAKSFHRNSISSNKSESFATKL